MKRIVEWLLKKVHEKSYNAGHREGLDRGARNMIEDLHADGAITHDQLCHYERKYDL